MLTVYLMSVLFQKSLLKTCIMISTLPSDFHIEMSEWQQNQRIVILVLIKTQFFVRTMSPRFFYVISFSSSSSSAACHAASTYLPDPLSPPVSIVHCSWEVFQSKSCIGTVLLYIVSGLSSCFCSSMWWGSQQYVAYEFILTSPAVSHVSGSSNLNSFRDGW